MSNKYLSQQRYICKLDYRPGSADYYLNNHRIEVLNVVAC
jgi:hypothetical protein